MILWVKIPDKPNVKSIVTLLQSLITQLNKADMYRSVEKIKINVETRAVEVHLVKGKGEEGT